MADTVLFFVFDPPTQNTIIECCLITVQEIIQGTKALLYLNYYTQVLTGEKKSGSEGLGYHLYFSIPLWETTLTRAVNPSFAPYSIIIVYIATSYTWICTRNMLILNTHGHTMHTYTNTHYRCIFNISQAENSKLQNPRPQNKKCFK